MADPQPQTYTDLRLFLDELREGVEQENGKPKRRKAHKVERDVWECVYGFLRKRGEFFRAAYPYYFDQAAHELIRVEAGGPELLRILREMGLLDGQKHTDIVVKNLTAVGETSPERSIHRFGYMGDRAIYIRHTRSTMFKVTPDDIEEVPLGTDGVILIAEDLPDWPGRADLQAHIDELRPLVANTCLGLLPDLPMTKLLTTRWSQHSVFTPQQAHQMFLSWVLFPVAGSRYPLWPILVHIGPQNSGKSTPLELYIAVLRGEYVEATALPKKERDLIASATNQSPVIYDNVDGADAREYDDLLARLATGAVVNIARLYRTNSLATFKLHNHVALTARVNPFTRSDVQRRMIVLEVAPAAGSKTVEKKPLIQAVLSNRNAILAEFLLRAQNIIRAHADAPERHYEFQSQMPEFEAFTLRCAEYEGTTDTCTAIWSAYKRQYEQAVTENNSLVYACRLWLGKDGNAGREVSATTLFSELTTLYQQCDLKLPYTAASGFGRHLNEQRSALGPLGFLIISSGNNNVYAFSPSPDEADRCRTLYRDAKEAALNRAISTLVRRNANRIEVGHYDYEGDDTSDLDSTYEKKGTVQ